MRKIFNYIKKNWYKLIILLFIIVALLGVIFYFCKFNYGFQENHAEWGNFGDFIGGVLGSTFGGISLISVFVLFKKQNDEEKFKNIQNFLKEYRSKEMGEDLKKLWGFYLNNSNKKSKKITFKEIKQDKKLCNKFDESLRKRYLNEHDKISDIYSARRNIAQFYLQLNFFFIADTIDKKIFYSIWTSTVLEIIKYIIIPCEESILEGEKRESTKIQRFEEWLITVKEYEKNHKSTE